MAGETIITKEETDTQIEKISGDLDCLQENVVMAPGSLALLGQIMLLSTKRDFSLIVKPSTNPGDVKLLEKREDFKFITHPESFRATLVQVSNAGYHAFLAAHTSMDKIRLACDNAQKHVRLITDCIIEGEDSDVTTMVPVSLKSMHKTAQDCAEWSRYICSKFSDTLNLLNEVHCSCHVTQMDNKGKVAEFERQKKILSDEKEEAEKNKQEKQAKIEQIEEKMNEERKKYLEDLEKSEHKKATIQKEVITEQDLLEKFKHEQEIAIANVAIEKGKRSYWKFFTFQTTEGIQEAKKAVTQKEYDVKEKHINVNTKKEEFNTEKLKEDKIIEQKQNTMKINEEKGNEDRTKSIKDIDVLSNKISEAISKLSTTDVTELDLNDIRDLLGEGIEMVAELEAHWKKLVLYFEGISNVTAVAMGKAIEDFTDLAEKVNLNGKIIEGSNNSLKTFAKKKLIEFAFDAYSRCNGVNVVSKSYLMISEKYLMPSIIELGKMVAIDGEREPKKIIVMTEAIQMRSQMTIEFVKQVVVNAKLENANEVKTKVIAFK